MSALFAPSLLGRGSSPARMVGALLLFATVSGCARLAHQGGFPEVRELASRRGVPKVLEWHDGSAQASEGRDAGRRLLDRELSADTAVQIALLNNPDLQATFEDLGIAQAEVVQAGLLKNPTLSGAALFGSVSPTYDFDLVHSFLDALLIPARTRITEAQFAQTRMRVAGEVFDLDAHVRVTFHTLQGAEQLVDVLSVALESAEASAVFAGELHVAGNLSDLGVATERSLAEEVRAELLRARASTIPPREELRRLLGLSRSEHPLRIARGLPGVPVRDPPLASLLTAATEQNLELAGARQEREVIAEMLETARTWRYLGGVEFGAETHREQGENNWIAGPSLSLELPLFDQRQAELARLESQLRQSERRADSVALSIAAEVRRAYGALDSARGLARHYRKSLLPARRRVVALTQEQYNYMLVGVFELLSAKREEIRSYGDYVDAVRDYWIARAELERAVGARVPLQEPSPSEPVLTPGRVAAPAHGEH